MPGTTGLGTTIDGEAIKVRVATIDDAKAIQEIYAPYIESTAISFETDVPDIAELQKRIGERLPMYPWLMAEIDGLAVGYAYAGQFAARAAYRWSVESSMYVCEGYGRKGIGRELYNVLLPILRRQGFRMAYAGIALPNAPSVGFHEAFGFREVAKFPNAGHKFAEWHDVGWWAIDLTSLVGKSGSIGEPIPFSELADPKI